MEKQIEMNIILEDLITNYRYSEYKKNKFINVCKSNISNYNKKINNVKSIGKSNEELEVRAEIYIRTCEEMILSNKLKISEAEKEIDSEYEHMRESIWKLLNENIINKVIDVNTLVENDKCIVYSIPSAKLIFQKQYIKIKDEKILKSFLFSNDLDYFDNEHSINFEDLEKDLVVCEDSSIIMSSTGLVVDGLYLTEHDLMIKYA